MTDTTQDHHAMWARLGLDLEKHDGLLASLGQAYGDLFLTQPNRPKGMEYFDFVMSEIHGLRVKELVDAREEGRKVIGAFCVFVPEELVLAVNGICVGLCAGADFGTEEAERYLPRNTCALIKSFFGFALEKVCPYISACDLIVGELTCDGKKKAYEAFEKLVPDLFVMDMPQLKSEQGRKLLKGEFERFGRRLEELTGVQLEVGALRSAIVLVNDKRRAMHRLARLRSADPAPISGLDALLANQVFFYDDPRRFTDAINKVCDELEVRISNSEGVFPKRAPRILVSGCPMAAPNWKLHSIVEASGAVIVGEESCVGERGTRFLVDEAGDSVEELVDNLVDRYFQIDCAIFTPNPSRKEHAAAMAKEYAADGVIHYALQFCTPYQVEAIAVERDLESDGIPTLRLDTDYGSEDAEQLRTRVEAFIERIRDSE